MSIVNVAFKAGGGTIPSSIQNMTELVDLFLCKSVDWMWPFFLTASQLSHSPLYYIRVVASFSFLDYHSQWGDCRYYSNRDWEAHQSSMADAR